MFKLNYECGDDGGNEYGRMEVETAKWAGEMLHRHYPGYPWFVEVRGDKYNAVIQLQIRGIMPPDRWYVVKFRDVLTDPGGKRTILKGAGELLERYNIPRSGFTTDHWRAALERFPIGNGRGHLEPLK
jgi:hypothetical protein